MVPTVLLNVCDPAPFPGTEQESPSAVSTAACQVHQIRNSLQGMMASWWKVMDFKRVKIWLPFLGLVVLSLCLGYQFLTPLQAPCEPGSLACAGLQFISSSQKPKPRDQFQPLYADQRRIAVCLVGGARTFELTGKTLRRHLLDVYNNTDVFLNAPLDADSHKFTLLTGRNLKAARIFEPERLTETLLAQQAITAWGSPHGLQGLLQYFNLVEGCWGMVKKYEVQHGFKYDWVIRTRVDGYWNGPLPDIANLSSEFYYVAEGSDFHGLNDRFGMGDSRTSRAAFARMSLIPVLHERGYRGLNSEAAYKAQLIVSGVPFRRVQLPFCIMTGRTNSFPPSPYGLLIADMATRGPLSGTYCRPCDWPANSTMSHAIVNGMMQDWDWPGKVDDIVVCNASNVWAPNWREIGEEIYKRDVPGAKFLPDPTARSQHKCVAEVTEFSTQWEVWDAPSADVLCKARF